MCLLDIYMSSLEKCLFSSLAHFLIVFLFLFVFLLLSCTSCLYILEINPLSVVSFPIIFFYPEGCLFTLFIVFFALQKLLSLIRSHLFNFGFISVTLGGVLNLTFCLYIESCPHCPHCLLLMTLCLLLSPFFRWRLDFCSLLRVTPIITVMLPSSLLDGSAKVNCLQSPRSTD